MIQMVLLLLPVGAGDGAGAGAGALATDAFATVHSYSRLCSYTKPKYIVPNDAGAVSNIVGFLIHNGSINWFAWFIC